MTKKQIILAALATIAVVIIASVVFIISRYHKVEIVFERPDISAKVYRYNDDMSDSKNIADLEQNDVMRLENGQYYIEPAGKNIDTSPISFTVDSTDQTIKINPGYSDEYYAQVLADEKSAIHKVITSAYPDRFKKGNDLEFKFAREQIYLEGDWYGAILSEKLTDPRDIGDDYRLILHKTDGKWEIVVQPELVISAVENPDIPKFIIDDINQLIG